MSNTIVDMPKVTQMLDAGWRVRIEKNDMGSYEVRALHPKGSMMLAVRGMLLNQLPDDPDECRMLYGEMGMQKRLQVIETYDFDEGWLRTDDFTPEQALTRMAYKIVGTIL